MESVRDVKRAMEREIAKGSSPLKLDHIEFGDYSYQEIMLQEKLFEVLTYLLRIVTSNSMPERLSLIMFIWICDGKSQYLREPRLLWKK